MANSRKPEPLLVSPEDPLARELTAVGTWIEDAVEHLGARNTYQELDPKALPSGQALLAGNPEQSRRFLLAALAQVTYWDQIQEQVRNQAATETQRVNAHMLPNWNQVWGRRRQAAGVVGALLRRALPLVEADLLALLNWCCSADYMAISFYPIGHLTRALERFASKNPVGPGLRKSMIQFAARLRAAHDKDAKRYGTTIEQLCGETAPQPEQEPGAPVLPRAQPAPAGSPLVLEALKRSLGMLPPEPVPATTELEPDQFALCDDSPLRAEHERLTAIFNEVLGSANYGDPRRSAAGQEALTLPKRQTGRLLLAAAERHVGSLLAEAVDYTQHALWQSRMSAAGMALSLLSCPLEVDRPGLFDLLLYLSVLPSHHRVTIANACAQLIAGAQHQAKTAPLTEGERFVLSLFRASLISGPPLGTHSEEVKGLSVLIQDGAMFYVVPGEAWADAVNEDLSHFPPAGQSQWAALLRHALTATTPRPSAKWLATSRKLLDALGSDSVREALLRWLPLVNKGQTIRKYGAYVGDTRGGSDTMHEENATCLRGLLWCVPLLPQRDQLAHAITAVALSAYKKVPGVGPRAVKVGNAAVYALSELASEEAVGQLAMLKVRVRFGTAQKEIEKAFTAAATALDLPRDQIEELGVPSYGLEEVGRRWEEFGDYRAELQVTGTDAKLKWFDANGKALKSMPARVKKDHKDDSKELTQALADIQSMLPAQRDRIDGMFLNQKTWTIEEWRERYHDHPLVGTIARRLLWCVDGTPALFEEGTPTDVTGKPIAHGKTAEVTLWHPVGRGLDEILGWRRRLEEKGITQPFKQAHREVYLLTDAERNTGTYSNRYAAHIIRQHQFNALCAARGWKNRLRLMVDDNFPPATRELPKWGLRAEFWIEGIGEEYGRDTNDSGVYLRLATDQVRFYRLGASSNFAHAGGGGYTNWAAGPGPNQINVPLPLDEIPPLVFSEIMRDVDLFVGVASLGNDPNWQDGGPEGRFRDYWHSYSFGELSGTAATRKQVLERLVPRLKIAKRCSFTDRFLVVRGDRRTYKIHLGSGNILMEPNDQYLCIVPDAKARAGQEDLYLPFEGDSTLSIILSKAFLLAEDTKIKDPTITRQIEVH